MSQLDGYFSLRTPGDLFVKLESDFGRFKAADPTSAEAQYAAFDFFVTALHMADWTSRVAGGSISSHRAYPDGPLVSDLGNGAKHFRVDPKRRTTVSSTGSAGFFDPSIFDPAIFDVARLVVDLEDGTTVDALDVAQRVLDHWRRVV
jgi:hypothetical protein